MSFDTNWDINKYKSEFEAEEHWALREKFLLTHQNKFPEEKLVCLAQVFYNIEFLGCRYPEKTMKLVAELSSEVAAEHREKQKNRLQRTFVKASDAAGAKLKGVKHGNDGEVRTSDGSQLRSGPDSKLGQRFVSGGDISQPKEEKEAEKDNTEDYLATLNSIKNIQGPCGPMAVLWMDGEYPFNSLQRTSTSWKHTLSSEVVLHKSGEGNLTNIWRSTATYDNVTGVADSANRNVAKLAALHLVIWKLQQHYYTVQLSKEMESEGPIVEKDLSKGGEVKPMYTPLAEDSVGSKMMKLMGWQGGGLGKNRQGISAPIEATGTAISRAGLGLTDKTKLQMWQIKKLIDEYRKNETDLSDLVFSPEFTNEERQAIHRYCQSVSGLRSRSIGRKQNRQLTISKKNDQYRKTPWLFLENMLKYRDTYFSKFKLIPPKTTVLPEIEGAKYLLDD